jgi:hypothetical protein
MRVSRGPGDFFSELQHLMSSQEARLSELKKQPIIQYDKSCVELVDDGDHVDSWSSTNAHIIRLSMTAQL